MTATRFLDIDIDIDVDGDGDRLVPGWAGGNRRIDIRFSCVGDGGLNALCPGGHTSWSGGVHGCNANNGGLPPIAKWWRVAGLRSRAADLRGSGDKPQNHRLDGRGLSGARGSGYGWRA